MGTISRHVFRNRGYFSYSFITISLVKLKQRYPKAIQSRLKTWNEISPKVLNTSVNFNKRNILLTLPDSLCRLQCFSRMSLREVLPVL